MLPSSPKHLCRMVSSMEEEAFTITGYNYCLRKIWGTEKNAGLLARDQGSLRKKGVAMASTCGEDNDLKRLSTRIRRQRRRAKSNGRSKRINMGLASFDFEPWFCRSIDGPPLCRQRRRLRVVHCLKVHVFAVHTFWFNSPSLHPCVYGP